MDQSLPTSPTLLDGLRNQREHCWDRFAKLYAPLVYRWGRKTGLQADDVADITQTVFQVVLKKIDQFDSKRKENGAFRSWLYGISRLAILDHIRSQARQASAQGGTDAHLNWQQVVDRQLPPHGQAEEFPLDPGADRTLLKQVLGLIQNEFKPSSWKAFWESAVAGRPAKDIAVDLGISTAAVRQAKYRILMRLREELRELE